MGHPKKLGELEFRVMTAVQECRADAYGAALMRHIEARDGREISGGALYTTLDRLAKAGMVEGSWGEPTAERGGRRKRFFKVTAAGATALVETRAKHQQLGSMGGLVPQGA